MTLRMIMVLAFFGLGVCHNAHTSGFYYACCCCYYFSTSEATSLLQPSYAAPSTAEANTCTTAYYARRKDSRLASKP